MKILWTCNSYAPLTREQYTWESGECFYNLATAESVNYTRKTKPTSDTRDAYFNRVLCRTYDFYIGYQFAQL